MPRSRIDEQLIQRAAFELWQRRGCPHGTAEQDWLEAERSLFTAAYWSKGGRSWLRSGEPEAAILSKASNGGRPRPGLVRLASEDRAQPRPGLVRLLKRQPRAGLVRLD